MPTWAGKWKGGRFYFDHEARKVFVIEGSRKSVRYTKKLATHDPEQALAELALFERDPWAYCKPAPVAKPDREPVLITADRVDLYLESIRGTVRDHRRARAAYLLAWGKLGIDLRTADRRALRVALASFEGGHRGRVEALNAFARWLVREGELAAWNPIVNTRDPDPTARAPRVAYTVEELQAVWKKLGPGPVRDAFRVRAECGMHHTEIQQVVGVKPSPAPLPDVGPAIRLLPAGGEFAGVVQIVHKKKAKKAKARRHRISVGPSTLAAVLRLVERVPDRITMWERLGAVGIVPSNLRHTFTTLAGEIGVWVTYTGGGVDRSRVAQVLGHRAGSTMTADRYDRAQVPPMLVLPLGLAE
jgi:integrase